MQRNIDRFARQLDLIRQSLDIPGMSVAILHRQKVAFAGGFGVVDVANGTRATENTPYPIASLTKTFTSAVIMRLVEAGEIDLDEKFSTYDPEYSAWCSELKTLKSNLAKDYNADSEKITVRHHLMHTAQGKPGTHYRYNSLLFARLASVVDTVSKDGFIRSIGEGILKPLGMNDSALGLDDPNKSDLLGRMAKPYKLDNEWNLVPSDYPSFRSVNGSQGLISTVMDLAKYDIAIDHGQVYSPQAKEQIWAVRTSLSGQRLPYGLGWGVRDEPADGPKLLWHYGQFDNSFSALLLKVPERELTLIFLASTDRASSVFRLRDGDPLRSPFVTTFLNSLDRQKL